MKEIAIVGMACRFPSGLDSINALVKALETKVNTAREVPHDRWSADWYFSENAAAPAKAHVRHGNFVEQDLKSFDAGFFDLPAKVAENLDPQQRLMLEVVWESFENAGIPLPSMAGGNVGVYVGGFMLDHMITSMDVDNAPLINQNTAAGMMMTMLSNRISHAFDLRGPSLTIDTACSSSLTAFNYACRDLWNGSCKVAVVGGVNAMTRPQYPVGMSKGQFLSRDGQCKSFDERGDGYGRGEGAGAIVLKEYQQALADGDVILAKVLGTGVNSDGRTPGISMPSGEAQEQLARDVCAEFDIDPHSIDYVECHGTGTAIGDPTEAGSIGRVFGAGDENRRPVIIGSIKSNIGHTEALAGVAGIIKAVLTLRNRTVYPLANLQTPNSKIPFEQLNLQLADKLQSIGEPGEILRAAVNSFGYGGTNAHAILESVPETDSAPDKSTAEAEKAAQVAEGFPRMLPISARSGKALRASAAAIADYLDTDVDLDNVLYTAAHRRAHLTNRAVALGSDKASLADALRRYAEEGSDHSVVANSVPFGASRNPVFVFTGMGPQWWGMGQELYRDNALYRRTLDEADAIFQDVAGFSILAEMLKDESESAIGKTEFAQPANFMVQLGVMELLKDAGIEPGAIVGHSVGEVGSAYAAGVLSLRDALTISFHRSRTQAKTAHTGSMLAVGLGTEDLGPYLTPFAEKLDIAANNGPSTLTVSGDTESIEALAAALTEDGHFNRVLTVEVPYHSYLMEPITDELIESVREVTPQEPKLPLVSTVSGQYVEGISYDGEYWARNVREPVAFREAMKTLLDDEFTTFIEVGPHPVLSSAIRDCARTAGKDVRLVETLRRGTDKRPSLPESEAIAHAVANTFATGASVDWQRLVRPGRQVLLPNYPWQREHYWLETDMGMVQRIRATNNPLLGYRRTSTFDIWRQEFSHELLTYLYDHVVTSVPVMPAAGYIEQILELGYIVHPEASGIDIRNLKIAGPMILAADRPLEALVYYDQYSDTVSIRSSQSSSVNSGALHVTADLGVVDTALTGVADIQAMRAQFPISIEPAKHYSGLARYGLQYGPAFQTLNSMQLNEKRREALGHLSLKNISGDISNYRLHPTLLDGCFQLLIGMLPEDSGLYLPTGFKSIKVFCKETPESLWCHGELVSLNVKQIVCDLTLMDESGQVVARVRGMEATAASGNTEAESEYAFEENEIRWEAAEPASEPARLGRWLLIGAQGASVAGELAEELEEFGVYETLIAEVIAPDETRDGTLALRWDQPDDFAELLEEHGPFDGAALVHGLDAGNEQDPTGEFAVEAMISLCKAISQSNSESLPRTYCVTRGAYAVEETSAEVQPAQTAIGGFCRVAHNELPDINLTVVDMPLELDADSMTSLATELLADMVEDEIALRDQARFMSVVGLTTVATRAVTAKVEIDESTVFRVRGKDDPEADGMVLLTHHLLPEPEASELRLRVTDMSVYSNVLQGGSKAKLDQARIPVVGVIDKVGEGIDSFSVGDRVFGYAPADFASHLQAPLEEMAIATLSLSVDGRLALEALDNVVGAEFAARTSGLGVGDTALVLDSDSRAAEVAAVLEELNVTVVRMGADQNLDQASVDAAYEHLGRRFDAIVAPMSQWIRTVGTEMLVAGGVLIDCDAQAEMIKVPSDLSGIIRTDINVIAGRPARLSEALRMAAQRLEDGTVRSPAGIPSELVDLVFTQFDLPPGRLRVDMRFDAIGESLPIAISRTVSLSPDASYLITGGLGGFGQRTAEWLVARGARTLVLASRSGANTESKQAFVAALQEQGVRVEAPRYDLSEPSAVAEMIDWIKAELPPLKGVFHSAAVIEDQDIVDIDQATYRRVMRSKATAAWALHNATMTLDLDHFVLYSSIANTVGNRRQGAYSTANGYLDGLAWHRKALGMPALAVNWGAISDVGFLAENRETEEFLKFMGIGGLSSSDALDRLEVYMAVDPVQISAAVMAGWDNWAKYEQFGSKSPRFAEKLEGLGGGNTEAREKFIAELLPLQEYERSDVVMGLIAAVVANELRQDADSIAFDRPIQDFGVDSLMAAEIQLILTRDLGIAVSVMDLLGGATIRAIADQTIAEFQLDQYKVAE